MKRILLFFTFICLAVVVHGQIAQWLIKPTCDRITLPTGANVIVTESGATKTLWSKKGTKLATVTDILNNFSEGYFVATQRDAAVITTIYDANGKPTPVKGYQLGWGYPFFHDGYLLVHDGRYYRFMNGAGQVDETQYLTAYPFSEGFASCYTFLNMRKMKSPYFLLLDKNLQPVELTVDGKPVNKEETEFISSLNAEGVAIVVIKRKVYTFDASTRQLEPLFATPDETNIKNQSKLDDDFSDCYVSLGDSAVLKTKCGRAGNLDIYFDSMLKPSSIRYGDEIVYVFERKQASRLEVTSPLKKHLGENGRIALYWDDEEVLPPQFTKVPLCFDDKAFIEMNGKYGMIRVLPNEHFDISLNKNKSMGFRHKQFETFIRLDMPPFISSASTSIEIDPSSGCTIDKRSKETKDTNDGNYVQYDCVLDIPENITDEFSEISYPCYVAYEGLCSSLINAKGTVWRSNYYNVDLHEQPSIQGGTLSFTINISADRLAGEDVYPYKTQLDAGGLVTGMEKVSDARYKCKVYDLVEGTNNIVVQITEEGCPPASYTFEVEYTKPKEHSGGRDKVVMKKKKKPTSPVSSDHLDI